MDEPATLQHAAWREFERLLEAPTQDRPARLDALRAQAPGLRVRVGALLEADRRAEAGASGPDASALAPPLTGTRVGPYLLERVLGAGGMGEVWLARRDAAADGGPPLLGDAPAAGSVALKLLHAHLLRSGFARFVREGRILAALRHDHVASLLDAGVADDGRPWLALEVVDGERIDVACDRRRLDVAARLRLFLQVCDAVAHAHARLVVHRDLKPSNILVVGAPDDPRVKLLDFGIAKLLDDADAPGGATATEITRAGARAFTPEYAAPEQLAGASVTTATDVHALGGLLYLLLSGRRASDAGGAAVSEAIAGAGAAALRASTPARLRATLRGDLDTIAAKALKPRPDERYASVLTLADDVRRHLAGRPVLARPDGWRYRATKFVRRHRVGVGAATAVATALVTGVVGTLLEARLADAQRARAERIRDFMISAFSEQDPFRRPGADGRSPAQLVAAATARLDTIRDDPSLHAELLDDLGEMAADLGDLPGGEALLRRAIAERRALSGADSLAEATSLRKLARVRGLREAHGDAVAVGRQALAILARRGQAEGLDAARVEDRLAADLIYGRGATPEILALLAHAQHLFEQREGPDSAGAAGVLLHRGTALSQSRRDTEAETALRDAIARLRRGLGPRTPREADALNGLGDVLGRAGRYDEARTAFLDALAIYRERLGPVNAFASGSLLGLASVQESTGRLPQALDTLVLAQAAEAPEALDEASRLLHVRARVEIALGRGADAERDAHAAYDLRRRVAGDGNALSWYYLCQWGNALAAAGRVDEAAARQREARAHVAALLGPQAYQNALVDDDLAGTLAHLPGTRRDEVVSLRRESLALTEATLGRTHPMWAERAAQLAGALVQRPGVPLDAAIPAAGTAAGAADEAERLLTAAIAVARTVRDPQPALPQALALRGRLRFAAGQAAGARADLAAAIPGLEAQAPRDEAALRAARAALRAAGA